MQCGDLCSLCTVAFESLEGVVQRLEQQNVLIVAAAAFLDVKE